MIKKEFEIFNKVGLHARPAALFVQTASKFKSQISIEKDNKTVNGKSIMGVLTLGASSGDKVMIIIDGSDEDEAIKAIEEFFNEKLKNL
ncbi:HPr family phosphocarrier protein [Tepidibacter aestuarii]|uniref:HPr family phosphocarrier protein n=1 Tax=Tepidibacter aestuarii TaxID=2925782 RepID=UPI0020BF6727|nr:HPr family phosphocarrier protein [Tepidibacter aestuarii]CAH2214840.1 catabolite repression HPr-like protein [Tepidibacter aestuarii]